MPKPDLYSMADIVIAAAPGTFVDRLTRRLPQEHTIWIHPDSARHLTEVDVDSVGVVVISETDCSYETLIAVLESSEARGWSAFVLTGNTSVDRREHWLQAGAAAVLSDRLAPTAVATMVRETLLGNLHLARSHRPTGSGRAAVSAGATDQ